VPADARRHVEGPFFVASDLPEDPAECDRTLLALMGSSEPIRQIDRIVAATA